MSASERLQGHTEVLSMILGHADRSAILSCLRVNKRYHTLAFRYIDTVYNHVFIDRDTVDSVFEGICWGKVEKRWTAICRGEFDRERSDLTESDGEESEDEGEEGQDGLDVGKKNTRPISILLDDSAELDKPLSFDSSWILEKSNRRMTLESLADGAPQLFGHDHQGQHDRKRYSLSKCRVLTLSDQYMANSAWEDRFHSHIVLHNGRAHRLFPAVETIRTIPPYSAATREPGEYMCMSEGSCCPFLLEMSPTKVVHRNTMSGDVSVFGLDTVKEVVVFLPSHAGPEPVSGSRHYGPSIETLKIVFGLRARQTTYSFYWAPSGMTVEEWKTRASFPEILDIIQDAVVGPNGKVVVYGLERAQITRAREWNEDSLEIGVYEAPTLQRKIETYIRNLSNQNQSPAPISFHTLEDYLESNPDDELFEHELHPPVNPSEWWISHYWTPGRGSNESEPVQALGELPPPTEIITEE